MVINNLEIYAGIVIMSVLAILWNKIDIKGGVLGAFITSLLYASIGYLGIVLIGFFFLIGTLASLYKINQKRQLGLAEKENAKRGWKNVVSNSGVAGIIAGIDLMAPSLFSAESLLIATCFASALSDTLSSELGNVSGKRYFQILTWEPSQRGQDGVVSVEGTMWGVVGSAVIALVYIAFEGSSIYGGVIMVAGIMGNIMDSVLGARWQQQGKLSNHDVNFISTALATALSACFIFR